MKAAGRTTLICRKEIAKGIYDKFSVVVKTANVDSAKKEYERQGYKVFRV